MSKYSIAMVAIALLLVSSSARASIVFDDFNTNVGHFNSPANTSGTTNILHTATGTANQNSNVRTTSDPLEGTGALQINITGGGQATPAGFPRIRFLSGGGTPASNVSFTTSTSGTDGWIGFYYKLPVPGTLPNSLPSGMQLHINLDGASGMDSGVARTAIMDGQWHLVEWDLDNAADWIGTPGISGDGILGDEAHQIDSVYFRYPTSTGWTGYTGQQSLFMDFVAKSDSGTIANLVPEPASLGVLALAAVGLVRRRR